MFAGFRLMMVGNGGGGGWFFSRIVTAVIGGGNGGGFVIGEEMEDIGERIWRAELKRMEVEIWV